MKLLQFFVCKVYRPTTIFYFSEHVIMPEITSIFQKMSIILFYSRSTYKTSAKSLEVVFQTFKQVFPHCYEEILHSVKSTTQHLKKQLPLFFKCKHLETLLLSNSLNFEGKVRNFKNGQKSWSLLLFFFFHIIYIKNIWIGIINLLHSHKNLKVSTKW